LVNPSHGIKTRFHALLDSYDVYYVK
jgi:hypothetical protein